jgi:hypothetical protein
MTRLKFWMLLLALIAVTITMATALTAMPGTASQLQAMWVIIKATEFVAAIWLLAARVKDIGYAKAAVFWMTLIGVVIPFVWIYLGCLPTGSKGAAIANS